MIKSALRYWCMAHQQKEHKRPPQIYHSANRTSRTVWVRMGIVMAAVSIHWYSHGMRNADKAGHYTQRHSFRRACFFAQRYTLKKRLSCKNMPPAKTTHIAMIARANRTARPEMSQFVCDRRARSSQHRQHEMCTNTRLSYQHINWLIPVESYSSCDTQTCCAAMVN